MALTKADLAKKLMEGLRMNKPTATLLVNQFFTEIKASLARGQAVKLSGFGN
jgi:integration host factor subunit alpha